MAGSTLLSLLDDIASLLDDVATLTKVATQKTAGVLGDDLALNAEQVTGVKVDRELPVVWAVAKGSVVNKAILVPSALAISAVAPWVVTVLLMIGGAFLCFEGFEKVAHKLLHSKQELDSEHDDLVKAVADPSVDMVAFEKGKIKGAIRTDFVLSAEIIVISLGAVASASFGMRVAVLLAISTIMTIGVYGLVAGIVRIDDWALVLTKRGGVAKVVGGWMLWLMPWLMKALSFAGTAAMFLVGGGIIAHGIPGLEDLVKGAQQAVVFPGSDTLVSAAANALIGILSGGVIVALVSAAKRVVSRKPGKKPAGP
jgi:uncharacterized protein